MHQSKTNDDNNKEKYGFLKCERESEQYFIDV